MLSLAMTSLHLLQGIGSFLYGRVTNFVSFVSCDLPYKFRSHFCRTTSCNIWFILTPFGEGIGLWTGFVGEGYIVSWPISSLICIKRIKRIFFQKPSAISKQLKILSKMVLENRLFITQAWHGESLHCLFGNKD